MIYIAVFVSSYVYVLAKSMQQLNVVQYKWMMIPIFSYIMALCEYGGFGLGLLDVAQNGLSRILILVPLAGTAGTLGSWSGMYLHRRIR